jgi:hypothetical protein
MRFEPKLGLNQYLKIQSQMKKTQDQIKRIAIKSQLF